MKENISYYFKGIMRAAGEGLAFYVLLPLWYAIIKISEFLKGNKHYGN
ncbi:MAG: hypothetical protein Q4D20_10365 [Clostridia bacterium]|nr:hypothetical protein [Clostridia bacterium]